jgi:hypothetical protein
MTGRNAWAACLAAAVVWCSAASPAMATLHHPKGRFSVFADCPYENPAVTLCMVAPLEGSLVLGNKSVPIEKYLTLQGGFHETSRESERYTLIPAVGGETLSKTALRIPGGLPGLGRTTVMTEATATPELVGPTSSVELNMYAVGSGEGTGLRLPLRVKLNNYLLGGNCYVGSASNPVVLDLTTGTTSPPGPNRPIKGERGEAETIEEPDGKVFLKTYKSELVDNAFTAPVATGCGILDSPIIDADVGLPASAGRNTAILAGNVEIAAAEEVRTSE